jgi:hypothetical protein
MSDPREEKILKPKKKSGRRKLDPAAVRERTIGVRVSTDELAVISRRAEERGMTPVQLLRETALSNKLPPKQAIVPAINREMYAELAKIGVNLNQLARAANQGYPVTVDDSLLRIVCDKLTQMQRILVGGEDRE